MSQEINNRERRKQAIKDTLRLLHEGKSVEEVQGIFRNAFDGVEASEISAAEQALISEGLPVSEVQRLCDVHSAVFRGSIAMAPICRESFSPMFFQVLPPSVLL